MSSNTAPDPDMGLAAGLRDANRILSRLADVSPSQLSDSKLGAEADEAARLLRSAQELVARLAAAADESGAADRDGAVSARAWLAQRGISFRDAARAHEQGTAMTPRTETTRLAWARG